MTTPSSFSSLYNGLGTLPPNKCKQVKHSVAEHHLNEKRNKAGNDWIYLNSDTKLLWWASLVCTKSKYLAPVRIENFWLSNNDHFIGSHGRSKKMLLHQRK